MSNDRQEISPDLAEIGPDLAVLADVFVQIRGLAGGLTGRQHRSRLSARYKRKKAALQAIYDLADAAHNIPQALADGPGGGAHFLLEGDRGRVLQLLHPEDPA